MIPLRQALLEHHLIVLRVLGEWYELDLIGQDNEGSADALSEALLQVDFREEFAYLQPEEANALRALASADGRLPVATFVREFGDVRQMGPGKLDREEPWLNPVSPAEALWYRGFLHRGFDETDSGLVEYFYVPDELLANMRATLPEAASPKPAEPTEPVQVQSPTRPPAEPQEPDADLAAALADVEAFIQKTRAARAQTKPVESDTPPPEPDPEPSNVVPSVVAEPVADKSVLEEPAPKPQSKKVSKAPSKKKKAKSPEPKAKQKRQVVGPKPTPKPAPEPPPAESPLPKPLAPLMLSTPPTSFVPASTLAVDDVTTILALSQRQPIASGQTERLRPFLQHDDVSRLSFLVQIALDAGLLRQVDGALRPARTAAAWLQQSRAEQLRTLFVNWQSTVWNGMRHVETLACEGEWPNDPTLVRRALLTALPTEAGWISAETLIDSIYQNTPDFQRLDGDYDNWYIRERASGNFLKGFESWHAVEGSLLRYVLFGPMVWLGLLDSSVEQDAVRLSARAQAFRADRTPQTSEVDMPLRVQPDATLLVPVESSRYERFQATRIAEPLPLTENQPYVLRITPASLAAAKEQGITPDRVLQFLEKASGNRPIPPGTRRAIERWGQNGTEGRLEQVVVLRVGDAAVIETLRTNPKTRDLLGESLGDLAVVVHRDQYETLRQVTAQLGLLLHAD